MQVIIYRDFEIEYFPGAEFKDETVPPTVMMSTELSPDPYEDKWYTEELWLEIGTTEQQGIETAKKWIDEFWVENS